MGSGLSIGGIVTSVLGGACALIPGGQAIGAGLAIAGGLLKAGGDMKQASDLATKSDIAANNQKLREQEMAKKQLGNAAVAAGKTWLEYHAAKRKKGAVDGSNVNAKVKVTADPRATRNLGKAIV